MQNVKSVSAIVFIAVGMAVLAMTMGGGRFGAGPMFPAAIPYLGVPFGLGLLAVQIAFCLLCDARDGLLWILVACVLTVPLALFGNAMNLYPDAIGGMDRVVTGPACASAIAIGFGVVRGSL